MSADEIRDQKAKLLLEHHEAQQTVAHLKEKAVSVGRDIQQFGKWLAEDPVRRIYGRAHQQYGLPTDLLDEKYQESVNFEKALALADQIREATANLKDLEELKGRLGL